MKKIVGLMAGLACLGAQAQSTVTVSGLVDAYVGSMRMAGDAGRVNVVGSGGMTTSYFGFTGTEDLGNGLKATFALTSFMRVDTGATGRFDNDPFFARDANVGLAGQFGSIKLGRAAAPNLIPSALANPFGNSFAFSPLILHANVNTARYTYRTTPSDTGWSNQVVYTTPNINGFQANIQYQFGEQPSGSGLSGKRNLGVNATYTSGPLTLVGYYEHDQISNPVNPSVITATIGGVVVPTTRKVWMVGGAYDAGFAKGYATYGRSTTPLTGYDAKTTSLGVSVPAFSSAGSVLVAVAHTDVSGPFNGNRTTASLGYDHFLSKRTDLYAVAMHDRVTGLSSGTSVAFGIRHRF